MKILTGNQIKEADQYTIEFEPVSSIDLMERASINIMQWISCNVDKAYPLLFVTGKGNNGGDGLAVARLLYETGYKCFVYIPFEEDDLSEESLINLKRLPGGVIRLKAFDADNIPEDIIIIDALFGTGVKGKINEALSLLIEKINNSGNPVISIDLPSGMKSEFGNGNQTIVKASSTLTLEYPKLAMLLPEEGEYCGNIHILPIHLHRDYFNSIKTPYHFINTDYIKSILKKREKFAHKGLYGHALLICGSRAMAGAAVLSAGGALRSGCGLVTIHLPEEERGPVYTRFPSAILSLDRGMCFSELPEDLEKYSAIGIGCGLGRTDETQKAVELLLRSINKPIVFDADALNILAANKELQKIIPEKSILTPHPGELKRLIGDWRDEEEKIERVKVLAKETQCVIVVKGAYTMITMPDGNIYFNSTGNSGMAKGGSGDVLTGFITGLLARGYCSTEAAIIGVYFHGLAGDRAAEEFGLEGMSSSDMLNFLKPEIYSKTKP